MQMKLLFSLLLFCYCSCFLRGQSMDNEQLERILATVSDTISGSNGSWQFLVDSLPMYCLTDEYHNRMRIVSPVKAMKEVSAEEMIKCMEANFHTALDVKYAISDDILWVAFIHPLKELSTEQALDAVVQVYNAAITFGTLYSSTDLVFPKKEEKQKVIKKS